MTEGGEVAVQVGIARSDAGLGPHKILKASEPLPRILVVEDERIVALDLVATLTQLAYTVVASVSSGEAAIREAVGLRPDLVLMDIRLAGEIDGIQAAEESKKKSISLLFFSPPTPMIRPWLGPRTRLLSAMSSNLSKLSIYIARLRLRCTNTRSKPGCGSASSGSSLPSDRSGRAS